jgi:hypothetical protein
MIKIITVQFSYDGDTKYKRLLDVLKYSAKINMPDAEFISLEIPAPEVDFVPGHKMLMSNTVKLQKWVEQMEKSKRGDKLAFLDADMLIMRDFSKVFKYRFDVAYTYRVSGYLPLNGGVMFAKPTKKAKDFFKKFLERNIYFLNHKKEHDEFRRIYAGMNQSAMGWMLERSNHRANILGLPCPLWNVCNEDWHKMLSDAYILHIKSRLRLMCLGQKKVSEDIREVVEIWQDYHKRMNNEK